MSALSLQMTYRKGQPFAAYIYPGHAPGVKVDRTKEVGPDILIDYAADGSPLGIEIISPGYVTLEEINAAFRKPGLTPPTPAELAPLRAA